MFSVTLHDSDALRAAARVAEKTRDDRARVAAATMLLARRGLYTVGSSGSAAVTCVRIDRMLALQRLECALPCADTPPPSKTIEIQLCNETLVSLVQRTPGAVVIVATSGECGCVRGVDTHEAALCRVSSLHTFTTRNGLARNVVFFRDAVSGALLAQPYTRDVLFVPPVTDDVAGHVSRAICALPASVTHVIFPGATSTMATALRDTLAAHGNGLTHVSVALPGDGNALRAYADVFLTSSRGT